MWPFRPNTAELDMAQRLLRQSADLQIQAALLLGIRDLRQGSGSTSSPVSTASSSPTERRIRGAESISILDRDTLLKQDLEAQRRTSRPPEPSTEPEPRPSGEPFATPKA